MAPSKLVTIDFTSFPNVIDGELRSSKNKYHGVDPTTKQANWDCAVASDQDIDDAVVAANKAFEQWRSTTWEERTEKIARFKELFESYNEELTTLLLKETGKPRMFGGAEVSTASKFFDCKLDFLMTTMALSSDYDRAHQSQRTSNHKV